MGGEGKKGGQASHVIREGRLASGTARVRKKGIKTDSARGKKGGKRVVAKPPTVARKKMDF